MERSLSIPSYPHPPPLNGHLEKSKFLGLPCDGGWIMASQRKATNAKGPKSCFCQSIPPRGDNLASVTFFHNRQRAVRGCKAQRRAQGLVLPPCGQFWDCIFGPSSFSKDSYLPVCKMGFLGSSNGKESAYNAGDLGLTPGSGRFPGGGHDNSLQYSCWENSMDREAWWATVHGVTKSWTGLSD